MAKMNIMDHTGHTAMEFDAKTKDGVSEAMERFNELVKEHKYTAAARVGDGQFKIIRSFDPTATEIILHPQLQGG